MFITLPRHIRRQIYRLYMLVEELSPHLRARAQAMKLALKTSNGFAAIESYNIFCDIIRSHYARNTVQSLNERFEDVLIVLDDHVVDCSYVCLSKAMPKAA